MITYTLRLLVIVAFSFLSIVITTNVFEGRLEILLVGMTILGSCLGAYASYLDYLDHVDDQIDSEYMSEEWLDRYRSHEAFEAWIASDEASRF